MFETDRKSVQYLKCVPGKPCARSSMPGDVANEILRGADAVRCEPLQGFDLSAADGFYRFKSADFGADGARVPEAAENAAETPSEAAEGASGAEGE